jgi:lysophospholipid acyltransferase (LPLAT)-like uncharacterized protein
MRASFRSKLWHAALWLLEHGAARLLRLVARTWRVQYIGLENLPAARRLGAMYMCTWHGTLYTTASRHRDRGMYALVSPVWEGDIIAAVLKGFGYRLVRGSGGTGNPADFRRSIELLREGEAFAQAMDGPEGPARKVKPGIITMASAGRAAMIPVYGVGWPSVHLPTWDRHELPLPFAKVVVGHGPPLIWPQRSRGEALNQAVRDAEEAMGELERRCEKRLREWKG